MSELFENIYFVSDRLSQCIMSDDNGALVSYLKDNPRMMGALFTIVLLLSQAGGALAGNAATTAGP